MTGGHTAAAWRRAGVLGLVYVLLAIGSIVLTRQPGSVATLWYANAVGSALLLRRPLREWPLLAALLAAAIVAANLAMGDALSAAATFVPANLLEMLLAAWTMRRAGLARSALRSPRELLLLLLLGGVLAPLIGAALGASSVAALTDQPYAQAWLEWFEGAAIGALSMLPLAALVLLPGGPPLRQELGGWRLAAQAPLAVAVALLSLLYLPFPFVTLSLPLLLGAMTLPFVATALLALLVSVTVAIAQSLGIFVPPPVTDESQQALVYLALAGALMPPLVLAAAQAALRDSHARLAARELELERANEGLEQFVHMVAHDLREPLNTIAQFGSLVAQDHAAQLPPQGRQYLDLVNGSAARLRRLLDDVLQFARLRGTPLAARETVVLDLVLQQVRQALAASLQSSGGTLEVDALPAVQGQSGLLSLLFQSLVSNGLKFVPKGRLPVVHVAARVSDGWAYVTVSDNGIGIAADDLPRLFKAFARLHLRREYDGSGLGLVLSRQIAQAHGGDIEAHSVPGHGSRFVVRLPVAA